MAMFKDFACSKVLCFVLLTVTLPARGEEPLSIVEDPMISGPDQVNTGEGQSGGTRAPTAPS
jgi:hypothetical protein